MLISLRKLVNLQPWIFTSSWDFVSRWRPSSWSFLESNGTTITTCPSVKNFIKKVKVISIIKIRIWWGTSIRIQIMDARETQLEEQREVVNQQLKWMNAESSRPRLFLLIIIFIMHIDPHRIQIAILTTLEFSGWTAAEVPRRELLTKLEGSFFPFSSSFSTSSIGSLLSSSLLLSLVDNEWERETGRQSCFVNTNWVSGSHVVWIRWT